MHLYRAMPKMGDVKIFQPVVVEGNQYFTNEHHNQYLRIYTSVTMTLAAGLKEDFYCKIRVFEGGQLTVKTDAGVICLGLEGTFIEANQTCECIRRENGDFEIIRERPVNIDSWTRIGSIGKGGFGRFPRMYQAKTRLMDGQAIIKEWPEGHLVQEDQGVLNPDLKMLQVWCSGNKPDAFGSGSWLTEVFFDQWDWSQLNPATTWTNTKTDYVSGIETIPVTMSPMFSDVAYSVAKYVLENSLTKLVKVQSGRANADGIYDLNIAMPGNNTTEEIFIGGITAGTGKDYNLTIDGYSEVNKITISSNHTYDGINSLAITNCPKLLNLELFEYYDRFGRFAQKNIDQIFIDLDTNGLSNGTVKLSSGFVFTAASDAARASLTGKGWIFTDMENNVQIN